MEEDHNKYWYISDYPELQELYKQYWSDEFWDWANENGFVKDDPRGNVWLAEALPAYDKYKRAGSDEAKEAAIKEGTEAQEERAQQEAEQSEADILNKDFWEWKEKYPEAAKEFMESPEWQSVMNLKMSEGNTPFAEAVQKWKERLAANEQAEETTAAETEEAINAPVKEYEEATKTQEETTVGDIQGDLESGYELRNKQAEIQQGMSDSADAAQQEAYNKYVQNATAGINRSRAGLLADQGTDATQNVQANYNANRQLGTSTQNDYLQKMQQAKSMQQQANNIKTGSFLNTMSGMLQGAGSGAALGAAI